MNSTVVAQSSNSASRAAEAQLISDSAQLEDLRSEWNELFEAAANASPPLRWEWVREWWRAYGPVYGDRGQGLRIISVRRGPDLIGILPLYQTTTRGPWEARRLKFISTGEAEFEETCAEYLDLLHMPGAAADCVGAVGTALRHEPNLRWDQIDLFRMSERSPLPGLSAFLGAQISRTKSSELGVCFISDLSGGFEAYLNRLSQGARGEARKLLREVERSGMVFELATSAEDVERYFDEMLELHQIRWATVGKAGCFAPRHADFHRAVARAMVPAGKAVLARLSFKGKAYAVAYGHVTGKTYHCYQRGVCIATEPVRSPGTATILLLMARLVTRGIVRYDHLAGTNSFKERFATDTHPLLDLRIFRPTARLLATTTGALTKRAAAKLARQLQKFSPGRDRCLATRSSPVSVTERKCTVITSSPTR
jgi:CelD/BcsL family acetyltransferase involved in cellulose biosynthesis